jgi:selenobiotic family peptide radical SAM maturase
MPIDLNQIFPSVRRLAAEKTWRDVKSIWQAAPDPERFLEIIFSRTTPTMHPGYLADLLRLEWTVYQVQSHSAEIPISPEKPSPNPTLKVLNLSWKNLPLLIKAEDLQTPSPVEPASEWVLIWQEPASRRLRCEPASADDLLVLKMLAEDLEVDDLARKTGLSTALIERAFEHSAVKGIIIPPLSRIRRDHQTFPRGKIQDEQFFSSPAFTLQWHVTQACDLHCRHCYDRSSRPSLSLEQSLEVLGDLKSFCRSYNVRGHISFTGGNPFLYPYFFEIYQAAVDKGFSTAILGNPVSREMLEKISAVRKPDFFQVSLEGLPGHNDYIRGPGHFDRTLDFLSLLKDQDIHSMVMLTLTRENLPQVLPLAGLLTGKTEAFFFNRLSPVGEGAALILPEPEEFRKFLQDYYSASRQNPILGLKDNLFNILLHKNNTELFGGCAGYGCSAAFNFLSLLPDGEVQACRKFPSPLGNILNRSLTEIYGSETAQKYRDGSRACSSCPIRPVCGGCLAIASSLGLDIFEERDPFCFFS